MVITWSTFLYIVNNFCITIIIQLYKICFGKHYLSRSEIIPSTNMRQKGDNGSNDGNSGSHGKAKTLNIS